MKQKGNYTLYELLFNASYILFIASTAFSALGIFNQATKIINVLSLTLAYLATIKTMKKGSFSRLFVVILLFAVSIYLTFVLAEKSAIVFFLAFVLAAKNVSKNKIIKLDLVLKIAILIAAILMEKIGFITTAEDIGLDQGRVRNALGFQHPNFTGNFLLSIYLDILFLKQKNKKTDIIVSTLFLLIIGKIVDSRAAAIGVIIAQLVRIIPFDRLANSKRKKYIAASIVLLIPLILSLLAATLPMNNFMTELDVLLSGRIHLFKAFYSHYGVSIFGHRFNSYGIEGKEAYNFVLDNSYLYLLIHDGILIAITILSFYMIKIKQSLSQKETATRSALISHAFVALMARSLTAVNSNLFLILPIEKEEANQK